MAGDDDKAKDGRLREMAQHRGFKLVKSRRRKPGGDFGRYGLIDATTGVPCLGIGAGGLNATVDQILDHLRGRTQSRWKGSLEQASDGLPSKAKARPAKATSRIAAEPETARRSAKAFKAAEAKPDPAPLPAPPAPPLEVRKARPADATAIASLLSDAGEEPDAAVIRREIGAAARRGEPLLVADQGGLVGMTAWHLIPLPHAPPLGRITLVAVLTDRRRSGIGRSLVDAAVEHMGAAGCSIFELVASADFGEIARFARALGFHQQDHRFAHIR